DNKVYFKKLCPEHGESIALVDEDAQYYTNAYRFARPGTLPHKFSTEVDKGCPTDCGLCADHEQHTCVPIIEITDYCNLECPVCIVDNQYSKHMTTAAFRAIIDRLVAHEGTLDAITISGGEPTIHPHILEFIDIASRPEVSRVTLVTNGLRIGSDRAFAAELKKRDVYVILQLDGFSAASHIKVRGRDLSNEKKAALDALRELDIATQLSFVPARGVNEHEIGQAVELMLQEDFILSIIFQPVALTGQGGAAFEQDPMDRITITSVIDAAAKQTDVLLKSDFFPLPCSHPHCVSLTYLLKLDDGRYMPFPRFAEMQQHLDLFRSTATIGATEDFDRTLTDVINQLWSAAGEIPDSEKISAAMKRALKALYPSGRTISTAERHRIAERQAKSIFIHHYMDRHNFDLERLRKCCHHYPLEDGRIMPACAYNLFYRGAAHPTGKDVGRLGPKEMDPASYDALKARTRAAGLRVVP
ncbi:MAG: radical SAM protein, partial [Myxococcales bacterium]|nr:radical SAM protein [Myxococcales bacterium]